MTQLWVDGRHEEAWTVSDSMPTSIPTDWGEASEHFDNLRAQLTSFDLDDANEAQTRFDVIDRIIKDVLGWQHGQIEVEVPNYGERKGYVDYILRAGDNTIVVEAKRVGAAFPSPTKRPKLKLTGTALGTGAIASAIRQAEEYATTKEADVVVVTNGLCWCFFSMHGKDDSSYASLLFPLSNEGHAELLFNVFGVHNVVRGSLGQLVNTLPPTENRLIANLKMADGRVDRNTIADYIMPALDNALYADALLASEETLKTCFVTTELRARYDSTLGIHLSDNKPELVTPARRIRKDKAGGPLDEVVRTGTSSHAPPVTLIIGQVGAGKSTYLKHFELISGRPMLEQKKAHWIYIDFEQMGKTGSPRAFVYAKLLEYLQTDHPGNPTDYKHAVEHAYSGEIAALARGPYAPIYTQRDLFNQKVAEHIAKDFEQVEPYVDKVLGYITSQQLCVLVLDNIDLYEDDALETTVFSEGLALSKRVHCHVIVSLRDKTFVRHRSDSTFDAYELRKLWLDPPALKAVLSSRLSYSKKILEGQSAQIMLANGMHLNVDDLSVFFDIVQRSILTGQAGDFIDYVSDQNIRKGLGLISNFLTSGHIQADRALRAYIAKGEYWYTFPFHEIFKGCMLGQWRQFREDRSEAVNIFDARLGARRLRLLRLLVLNYLLRQAQSEATVEVAVADCFKLASSCGATEPMVIECLTFLYARGLIKSVTGEVPAVDTAVAITRSGGYYAKVLSRRLVYMESCLFDTAIDEPEVWQSVYDLSLTIDAEPSVATRMELRKDRIDLFLGYLCRLEDEALSLTGTNDLASMPGIRTDVLKEASSAIQSARRRRETTPD